MRRAYYVEKDGEEFFVMSVQDDRHFPRSVTVAGPYSSPREAWGEAEGLAMSHENPRYTTANEMPMPGDAPQGAAWIVDILPGECICEETEGDRLDCPQR